MARVTVEDCIKVVPSRFELVALATQRARAISSGAPLIIARDDDKDPVIALREIAKGHADTNRLRENLIDSFRTNARTDDYGVEKVSEVASGATSEVLEQSYEDDIAILAEDALADSKHSMSDEGDELSGLYAGDDIVDQD